MLQHDVKVGQRIRLLTTDGWSSHNVGDVLTVVGSDTKPSHLEVGVGVANCWKKDFDLAFQKVDVLCTTKEEFTAAQDFLFAQGYKWHSGDTTHFDYFEGKPCYLCSNDKGSFGYSEDRRKGAALFEAETTITFVQTEAVPVVMVELDGLEYPLAEVEAAIRAAKANRDE